MAICRKRSQVAQAGRRPDDDGGGQSVPRRHRRGLSSPSCHSHGRSTSSRCSPARRWLANALGVKEGSASAPGLSTTCSTSTSRPSHSGSSSWGWDRRRLLPAVPLGDPQVEPAHARPRGRRRRCRVPDPVAAPMPDARRPGPGAAAEPAGREGGGGCC